MNDRYKYRGKRVDNGEWEIGYYACLYSIDNHTITDEYGYMYQVNPTTIGQCTGLRDKNGVLIFEGDRVLDTVVDLSFVYYYGDIEHTVISKFTGEKTKVKVTCFYQVYDGVEEDKVLPMEHVIPEKEYLIIGTIHEEN